MTIGIAIPLKAKNIAKNWQVACNALEATLRSILQQSDDDYKVVVVGHDCPDFLLQNQNNKIRFKQAEFAEPDRSNVNFSTLDLINDKRLKIISALVELQHEDLSYIYQLDSDDLLHIDFIKTIKSVKNQSGIILRHGYLYYQSAQRYIATDELDQLCGSTVVIAKDAIDFPSTVDLSYTEQIPWTKYRHMSIYKYFEQDKQLPFCYLSEKLVAYVLASGDNFSDRWRDNWFKQLKWNVKPYILGKKVGQQFKAQFAIK
jgi:hypothetical protein